IDKLTNDLRIRLASFRARPEISGPTLSPSADSSYAPCSWFACENCRARAAKRVDEIWRRRSESSPLRENALSLASSRCEITHYQHGQRVGEDRAEHQFHAC